MAKDLWEGLRGSVKSREPLKRHTTFKVGGPAELFFLPQDTKDLKYLLALLKRYKIPFLMIGAGSNILAPDRGIRAAVIKLSSSGFRRISFHGALVQAGSGCTLKELLAAAARKGLSGLEFLAGIPGTVGGALVMNAGAWSGCIGDLVEEIRVLDKNGRMFSLRKSQLKFGYRKSSLDKFVVLSAHFRLKKGKRPEIKRGIVEKIASRRNTQDLSHPNAGCIFKNPKGNSAGRLIDQCRLKGKRIGGARISMKHANFILNENKASAGDIMSLMELARKKVKKRFNIDLEPEVRIWQ